MRGKGGRVWVRAEERVGEGERVGGGPLLAATISDCYISCC